MASCCGEMSKPSLREVMSATTPPPSLHARPRVAGELPPTIATEPVERDFARAGRPPSTLLDVKVLLVSADPKVRETMELTVRNVKRSGDQPVEFLEASDG